MMLVNNPMQADEVRTGREEPCVVELADGKARRPEPALDEWTAHLLRRAAGADVAREAAEELGFDVGVFARDLLTNLCFPLDMLLLLPVTLVTKRRDLLRRLREKNWVMMKDGVPVERFSHLMSASIFYTTNYAKFVLNWSIVALLLHMVANKTKVHTLVVYNVAIWFFATVFGCCTVAIKHACRREAAQSRMTTGVDFRDEEFIFGFLPYAPWLALLESRLAAAGTPGFDATSRLRFSGRREAEAGVRLVPAALEAAFETCGFPDALRVEEGDTYSVSAGALLFRVALEHSTVGRLAPRAALAGETSFNPLQPGALATPTDVVYSAFVAAIVAVPFVVARCADDALADLDGRDVAVLVLCALPPVNGYVIGLNATFRTWFQAVRKSISRRCDALRFLGALVKADDGDATLPRLVPDAANLELWLRLRDATRALDANVRLRVDCVLGLLGAVFLAAFLSLAVKSSSENAMPFCDHAPLLLFFSLMVLGFGAIGIAVSLLGDAYNDIAHDDARELSRLGLKHPDLAPAANLAVTSVLATQALDPLALFGLFDLDVSAFNGIVGFILFEIFLILPKIELRSPTT